MSNDQLQPVEGEESLHVDRLGDDELVGTTLSNTYEIVGVIGEGGTGRVYEARHTRIPSKRFAVKLLHAEYARHPEAIARFTREAEAAARVAGAHSVAVVDVDCLPDGRPYLVSELLKGVDLGEHLEDIGALSITQAVKVARQVCTALSEAHKQGVVHRDVKPDNVFLTGGLERPVAKVLDFGLSRLDTDSALTRSGMIMGTPMYMSPEQARGERVDHRTDIYGVGCILYRALTGSVPFDRDDPNALILAVLSDEPTRLRSLRKDIPESLELVVQRAMAKEPKDRFQSVDDLDAALAEHDELTVEPAPPSVAGPPPQRARLWLVIWLTMGVGWLVAASLMAISGVLGMLQEGGSISATALAVMLVVITTTLITPLYLVIRHVSRNIWQSSPKVNSLRDSVRAGVVASLAAYGVAALFVTLADRVFVSVTDSPLVGAVATAPWKGWVLIFLLVSAVAGAGGAMLRGRSRLATFGGGLPTALAAVTLCGTILYTGFALRSDAMFLLPAQPVMPQWDVEPDAPAEPPAADASSSSRATAVELEQAKHGGAPAVAAVAKSHPGDPMVLKALAIEQGRDSKTFDDALGSLTALFELAPEMAPDKEIRALLVRIAGGPKETSARALEIMARHMLSHGPDILYDIMISSPKLREPIKELLAQPEVRARSTPALRIAFDLKHARSCDVVHELLERAQADGDGRAVVLLSYYSDGTRRGCGWKKRQPCRAKCLKGRTVIRAAAKAVRTRLEGG